MKCLCICQCGHSRSVALSRLLHEKGIPAVAIGATTSGAVELLSAWADRVFVLQACFAEHVPLNQRHKVVVFDVGPDRWANPYNQELLGILREMLDKFLKELP